MINIYLIAEECPVTRIDRRCGFNPRRPCRTGHAPHAMVLRCGPHGIGMTKNLSPLIYYFFAPDFIVHDEIRGAWIVEVILIARRNIAAVQAAFLILVSPQWRSVRPIVR
ncbi:hypothetical protein [Burkholderia ambifaria]